MIHEITPEIVNNTLAMIPTASDPQLVHVWKICATQSLKSNQKLLEPVLRAVELERKKRAAVLRKEQEALEAANVVEEVVDTTTEEAEDKLP